MSDFNPYAPPQSRVDHAYADPDIHIDNLPVSKAWKEKFKLLKKAGGPSLSNLKNLSFNERAKANFNVIAFLFGPFYYIAKGMWKKGVTLFIVCFLSVFILQIVLGLLEYGHIGKSLSYGILAIFATRANIDYYKKMVLGDNRWW